LTITANQKCAWCKATKDIKVHYKYGFDWIVYDCLSLCQEDEIPKSFVYDIDNSAIFKQEDEEFADDWYLQTIILKCGVGCRSLNGKITIDGRKLSGYTNIIFVL